MPPTSVGLPPVAAVAAYGGCGIKPAFSSLNRALYSSSTANGGVAGSFFFAFAGFAFAAGPDATGPGHEQSFSSSSQSSLTM